MWIVYLFQFTLLFTFLFIYLHFYIFTFLFIFLQFQTLPNIIIFNTSMPLRFLFFLFLSLVIQSSDPTLIQMADKDECLKQIIEKFLHKNDCHTITDTFKTQLAYLMTNCLMTRIKKTPLECNTDKMEECVLTGDSWNTFSTFYAHIDNLCHFYRQILWQQRAQKMVSSLTVQAELAKKLMVQNANETSQILRLQNTLKMEMMTAILGQKYMMQLLANSSKLMTNMTSEMQYFFKDIHEDINTHYSSLKVILEVISQSIGNLSSIQAYLISGVDSINGILYFTFLFIFIFVLGSLDKLKANRNICLIIIVVSFFIEFLLLSASVLISTKMFRIIVLIVLAFVLYSGKPRQQHFQEVLQKQLNTARLKRIMRQSKVLMEIDNQ